MIPLKFSPRQSSWVPLFLGDGFQNWFHFFGLSMQRQSRRPTAAKDRCALSSRKVLSGDCSGIPRPSMRSPWLTYAHYWFRLEMIRCTADRFRVRAFSPIRADDEVVSKAEIRAWRQQVKELQRVLGKKTLENEILREAVKVAHEKNLSRICRCCPTEICREPGSTDSGCVPIAADRAAERQEKAAIGLPNGRGCQPARPASNLRARRMPPRKSLRKTTAGHWHRQ
jgi:hypothetical protein